MNLNGIVLLRCVLAALWSMGLFVSVLANKYVYNKNFSFDDKFVTLESVRVPALREADARSVSSEEWEKSQSNRENNRVLSLKDSEESVSDSETERSVSSDSSEDSQSENENEKSSSMEMSDSESVPVASKRERKRSEVEILRADASDYFNRFGYPKKRK